MDAERVKDCTVPEQHPSTQGHFPGQPVVPGAYSLARIEQLILEDLPGKRVVSLRKVKFLKPLLPGVAARLHYQWVSENRVQFFIADSAGKVLEGSASLGLA